MPLVEKDILRPGNYRLPDGSVWCCTCADVRNALVQGNRMIRGGVAVPLVWEHDLDAVPTPLTTLLSQMEPRARRNWAAGFAKHCFGHVAGFSLRIENGRPVLYATHDIPDPADAEQWRKTRYCSPRVDRHYTDGHGRYYPGLSVTHVAATPKPVQANQFPVHLSTAGGPRRETVFLSADSYQGDSMADDTKPGDKGGSDNAGMQRLLSALTTAFGFNAPDCCKSMDDLCLALEAVAANKGGGLDTDGDADNDGVPDADEAGMTAAGGAPVMMSDAARKAETKLLGRLRKELGERAERVVSRGVKLGAIDMVAGRDLIRRASGANLSLTADGDVARSEITVEIESLERVVSNLAKRNKGSAAPALLSQVGPAPEPDLGTGDIGKLIEDMKNKAVARVSVAAAKK